MDLMSPPEDVPAEDVLNGDVPVEDIKSPSRTSLLRMSLCRHKVPVEDMTSAQGHNVLGRMFLCRHHVPDEDVPVEDILDGDVPVKDMSVEDMMSLDGCLW